jgi:hypothetical protein
VAVTAIQLPRRLTHDEIGAHRSGRQKLSADQGSALLAPCLRAQEHPADQAKSPTRQKRASLSGAKEQTPSLASRSAQAVDPQWTGRLCDLETDILVSVRRHFDSAAWRHGGAAAMRIISFTDCRKKPQERALGACRALQGGARKAPAKKSLSAFTAAGRCRPGG